MIVGLSLLNKVIMKGGQMCWICERLENLITVWNEEREFQEQTSSDDYHRGLLKGFSECVKDLSDALSSMRMKGVCEKFTRHESSLDDEERLQILNDLLKLRDENGRQE
jgi:hypothetical protein